MNDSSHKTDGDSSVTIPARSIPLGLDGIRTAFERGRQALRLRPAAGTGTAVSRVRLGQQLRCDIEDGEWSLVAGMSQKAGGDNGSPNPGVYGRAALGACLAVGYGMWAAHLDIQIISLEVEVRADYNARGLYGVGDSKPGYVCIRYVVSVESDAPENEVRRMIETADAHSDFLFVFREPQDVRREAIEIRKPGVKRS
jgi:uncharacterized OsmC-like protein